MSVPVYCPRTGCGWFETYSTVEIALDKLDHHIAYLHTASVCGQNLPQS